MFVDMAFGSPIYERLHAPRVRKRLRSQFWPDAHAGSRQGQYAGLYVGPDEGLAAQRGDREQRKDGGRLLESKADMQKRGSASPDDGDALALTFAAAVAPAELEDPDEDEEEEYHNTFRPYGIAGWMR